MFEENLEQPSPLKWVESYTTYGPDYLPFHEPPNFMKLQKILTDIRKLWTPDKRQEQGSLAPAPLLGDAPSKKPYGLEDAIAEYKKQEAEMQEKMEWINTATDEELLELMALADFTANSSFLDKRFTQKVMLESMRRILMKLKSHNDRTER